MNRILSIAILLLTLLTAAEVSAQSYYNEMYSDCDVTDYGQGTVVLPCFEICRSQCSSCQSFFDCDEIAEHEKGCYYECNKCKQKMKVIERDKHKCKGDEPDPKPDNDPKPESDPGKPDNPSGSGPKGIPDQVLPNVTVNGKNKSSFNWWDWTLVYGGGSSSSNNNNNESGFEPTEEQPLHAAQQSGGKTDSIGYHRCPCMITANAKFYLNDIDNDPKWDNLNKLYYGLTDGLKRHLAFPETIQQGNNATCAAALIQKYLAENYPDKYKECVYELAKNGKYEPWGLEIPLGSNLNAISDYELRIETGDANKYNQGINFTADDALMQTAIQNWVDVNNLFRRMHNKITGNAYSVIDDNGNIGGMTADERSSFLFNVSPHRIVNNSGKTSYNELTQKLETYSPDDYTIMAGVNMQYDDNGCYFGDSLSNHALEINGIEDGYINFWCYGKDGTTVKKNGTIKNIIIMKKTDYAKEEKKDRKSLVCNCPNCTNDGCSKCM